MQMRTAGPMIVVAPPRHTRAIVRTLLLPATVRNDTPRIRAIAAETPDERSRTRGMLSRGTTRGERMRLRAPPIPFRPRTDTMIGALSQGATGRVLSRVSKATTVRATAKHETTGRLI
jgi:hypothetical protein